MRQIRKNIVDYNNLYQVSNMKYTVYIIRHISTGTVLYVGKTNNFKRRAYEHLKLRTKTKKWLSVVGTGNVLIEEVAKFNNKTDALKYEDELILKYNTIENGYNNNRSGLIFEENPEEYHKKYNKTDKYKEYQKEYQKEYRNTNKSKEYQKEYQKEYRNTNKSKEYQKEYQKEYRNTNKSKEYQKKYHIDYMKAKKIGISISEYRKLKNDQGTTLEQNKKQPIQLAINF